MSGLEEKIRNKTAVISIIGLGYVGLPLAVSFAEAGLHVVGFDMQDNRVESIIRGESYIADISNERLAPLVENNLLEASTDKRKFQDADVFCICVPTPLTTYKEPDLSYVVQVCEDLCGYIKPDTLIVLESTTYPGTVRQVILPILELSKLKCGRDFYLAYSPERIDPGNNQYNIRNTPKLVAGIDSKSTNIAKILYGHVTDTIFTALSLEAAEMSKLFENVFRSVNIALVNELARLCDYMGISVWEVINGASTKPFGYMPFYPSLGVGGHCIPVDPYYLSSKAKEFDFHTRFIELAADINEQMPAYVSSCIMDALSNHGKCMKDAVLLVLGVAYKKNSSDVRESPSLKLIKLLNAKGAKVSYHDPYVYNCQIPGKTLTCVKLTKECLSSSDCVIIATDHSSYDLQYIVDNASLVFDATGATRGIKQQNLIRLGESNQVAPKI